jgi:hypothetical protein
MPSLQSQHFVCAIFVNGSEDQALKSAITRCGSSSDTGVEHGRDEALKGIVSLDFEVCFLVPLDSSDIATLAGTGSFLKRKSILCRIFDFLGLGASSFYSERISAQRATRIIL